MVYCGCQGCPAKTRWFLWTLSIIGAAVLLTVGLIKTVPALQILFQCVTKENSLSTSGVCWTGFWNSNKVHFILTCVGIGLFLISLLTCCCFCCARSPASRRKDKDQFIQGEPHYDTGVQGDQYNYGAITQPPKGPAHV